MESLWGFDGPWWHVPARAAVIYVTFLILIRLSGKRTVGEFTTFDLIVVILIAETAQSGLMGREESITATLLGAAVLVAANWIVGAVSARSPKVDRLMEGEPAVLARNGRVFERALRRHHVSRADLEQAMRREKCEKAEDIRLAMLETDGEITIETK